MLKVWLEDNYSNVVEFPPPLHTFDSETGPLQQLGKACSPATFPHTDPLIISKI